MGRKNELGAGILGALSVGAVVSGVAGVYKVSEAAIKLRKLREVEEDYGVFVRLVERVRLDLAETERLLKLDAVKIALARNPEKLAWIAGVITSTKKALADMNRYTKRCGGDLARGSHVGWITRVRWVLNEHERLMQLRLQLGASHQGLLQVMGFLSSLEPLSCCSDDHGRFPGVGAQALTYNPGQGVTGRKSSYTLSQVGGSRSSQYTQSRQFNSSIPLRVQWPASKL